VGLAAGLLGTSASAAGRVWHKAVRPLAAFAGFVGGKTFNAAQLHFVDLVVMHLTESGVVPIDRLYASPYTDMPLPDQRTCSVART
jgi:hypothetical protein